MKIDDRDEFLKERQRRLERISPDNEIWRAGQDFFDRATAIGYSYNFDWLGIPIIQFPQDIIAIQEILWKVKPDLIIETGVARGGSIIFYASLLRLIGNGGVVVGIDIDIRTHNRHSIETHPIYDPALVKLIEGSSTSVDVLNTVREYVARADTTLIILDSNHTHEHVLRELKSYSSFVNIGSYLIVLDTVIDRLPAEIIGPRPWGRGNSPLSAIEEFLSKNNHFEVDRSIDAKLIISVSPAGYLKRVRDIP